MSNRKHYSFLRFALYSLVAAIVLVISGSFLVSSKIYSQLIDQLLIGEARKTGSLLTIDSSDVSILKYSAATAKLFPPHSFISIDFSELVLSPRIYPLIFLNAASLFSAKIYDGQLEGQATYNLRSGHAVLDANLKGVQLRQHPMIEGFGIRQGTLGLYLDAFTIDKNFVKSGTLKIELSGVDKPAKSSFSLYSIGVPMDIQIPRILGLSLYAECAIESESNIQCKGNSSSSIMNLEATYRLSLVERRPQTFDFSSKVHLSEEGLSAVGTLLPLASSGVLNSKSSDFSFTASGSINRPNVKFEAIRMQ